MTDRCGLKILNVDFNNINGGSFAVTVARRASQRSENTKQLEELLAVEDAEGLSTRSQHRAFGAAVTVHKQKLLSLLLALKEQNSVVLGYGASTKGNVLLQHCGINPICSPRLRRSIRTNSIVSPWHEYPHHLRARSACEES